MRGMMRDESKCYRSNIDIFEIIPQSMQWNEMERIDGERSLIVWNWA